MPGPISWRSEQSQTAGLRLITRIAPLAQPKVAGIVALAIYLLRALAQPTGLHHTDTAYFNFLADAFLHGQLHLRAAPEHIADLISYGDRLYPYWPPFPALLVMPLVATFGVGVSDVVYTAVFGAISIALLAKLLQVLDDTGIAPLNIERRAILVTTMAFGSVLLILAPVGRVWYTAQIVGWGCALLATIIALTRADRRGYFLTGLALACAATTRTGMLFNGVWLAYLMLQRDRAWPLGKKLSAAFCGLAPIVVALLAQGWYNWSRFGHPLEMGLKWHHVNEYFRGDFERYGTFSLHYLPGNLYYQFVAYTIATPQQSLGGGLFWMTPVLLGAPAALWLYRRNRITWALLASCVISYIPVGLCMGTGYLTFGPRYLLDLMVPIVVLTAIGIRRWRMDFLQLLMIVSCATYVVGSALWAIDAL